MKGYVQLISFSLCFFGLTMGCVPEAPSMKEGAEMPSCDTPELEAMRDVLVGVDTQARTELFENELYPMARHPAEVPENVQRCLIEAFLATTPLVPLQRSRETPSIELMHGGNPFYDFYQPEYLERLFLRVPASTLVGTYGRKVVPLIIEHRHHFDDTFWRETFVNLVERTLVYAEDHGLELQAGEREQLEAILRSWVDHNEMHQLEPGRFLHLRFDLRFGPEEWRRSVAERAKSTLCENNQWYRIHVLQDMEVLDLPGTAEVLEELAAEERDETVVRYVEAMAAYHRGESESFPPFSNQLSFRVGLGSEHDEMADLEICSET